MALTKINTNLISNNTITVTNIADNAVDATKIAQNSILTRHIDDSQIITAHLADDAVTLAKMANSSVGTGQIVDSAVTNAKYANLSITSGKLATNLDLAGTLDVTGATTLDSTLGVTGATTFNALTTSTVAAGAGDAIFRWAVAGNETWQMGIDNSDADKLKIGGGSNLGTTDYMTFYGNKIGVFRNAPAASLEVGGSGIQINDGTAGTTPKLVFGTEPYSNAAAKCIFMNSYWMTIQGHRNEGIKMHGVNASGTVQEFLRLTGDNNSDASEAHFYSAGGGQVAINNAAPAATLHVTGTEGIRHERAGAGTYDMTIDNTVTGDAADLNFIAQTNDTGYHFRTRKSDGNLRSAFSISANGHIGIGHADPESGMDSSSYTQIKLGCGQIGDSGDSSGGNTYIANNLYSGASNDMKFRYAVPASMIGLTGGDIRVTTHDGGGASADATATMVTRFFIKENGLIAVGAHTPVGTLDVRDAGGASLTPSTTTPLLFTASNSGSKCHHEFRVDHNSGVKLLRFVNPNGEMGDITMSSSTTAYNSASDYRLKENIDYTWDATTRLKQLKPCRFNWISDETNALQDGFIAHEVSSIVPIAVSGEKDAVMPDDSIDPQSMDQSKLIPLLVKTIQELEARITTLEG